jgi:hypothetical protein
VHAFHSFRADSGILALNCGRKREQGSGQQKAYQFVFHDL